MKVIFIKLIRILAVVLAIGLVCHLLYSAGKKSTATRQRRQGGKERRKFVKSSVIEKKNETSDKKNS